MMLKQLHRHWKHSLQNYPIHFYHQVCYFDLIRLIILFLYCSICRNEQFMCWSKSNWKSSWSCGGIETTCCAIGWLSIWNIEISMCTFSKSCFQMWYQQGLLNIYIRVYISSSLIIDWCKKFSHYIWSDVNLGFESLFTIQSCR